MGVKGEKYFLQEHSLYNLLYCRAFITALANGNTIRVFKVNKKKDGSGASVTGEFDFPVKHSAEIINIAVASNGKFIMSCSRDTTIIIWNLKGKAHSSFVIVWENLILTPPPPFKIPVLLLPFQFLRISSELLCARVVKDIFYFNLPEILHIAFSCSKDSSVPFSALKFCSAVFSSLQI